MFITKPIDWWRDQIFLATADFLKNPNDITSAKIKSLLKTYQLQHGCKEMSLLDDEHERAMDYR